MEIHEVGHVGDVKRITVYSPKGKRSDIERTTTGTWRITHPSHVDGQPREQLIVPNEGEFIIRFDLTEEQMFNQTT